MKSISSILLIAILSFTACLFFPWWSIAIVAFLVSAIFKLAPGQAMFTGFTSLFILWGITSYLLSTSNAHILAHKISPLIIKVDNPFYLFLLTGFIGGLVSGLAALTGSYIRRNKEPA